ncbi:MAG: DUF2807 domain-containing protein [Chitinophagaceae bacterium]|nr:DUF2807 domain-containing protein [Chitinophagaceae bacterium]
MRRILFFLTALVLFCASCRFMGFRRIKGNGHLSTEERHISHADHIVISGSFDVQLTQGAVTTLKLEADDNLLQHIATDEEGGTLHIRPRKRNTNFQTDHAMTVYITTPKIERVAIEGSGSVIGKSKFAGGERLTLSIGGSGDIDLEVNTPEVKSNIAGSGTIILRGETQNETIGINGSGNFFADALKAENATVSIAGAGDVKLFADATLNVNIAGSGSVLYKGNPSVKQKVIGGGDIRKID